MEPPHWIKCHDLETTRFGKESSPCSERCQVTQNRHLPRLSQKLDCTNEMPKKTRKVTKPYKARKKIKTEKEINDPNKNLKNNDYLLRRLEGFRYSFTGHNIVLGRRGFGQITSSSLPSTRKPDRERRPSLISGRGSNELQAPANCWTPPRFLAISSFPDFKHRLPSQKDDTNTQRAQKTLQIRRISWEVSKSSRECTKLGALHVQAEPRVYLQRAGCTSCGKRTTLGRVSTREPLQLVIPVKFEHPTRRRKNAAKPISKPKITEEGIRTGVRRKRSESIPV